MTQISQTVFLQRGQSGFYAIILLLVLSSSCIEHGGRKHPPDSKPPVPSMSVPSVEPVEQQLLSTVKQAETLGPGNPLLLSSLYSLANYYQEKKEFEKAAEQYQRILEIKEHMIGPNHPDIADILQRYARLLHQANRHSEAQNLSARAEAILAQSSIPRSR